MKKFWEAGITDSPVPNSKFRVLSKSFKDNSNTKKSFSGSARKYLGMKSSTKQPADILHQYWSPNPKSKKHKSSIKHQNLFMSTNDPDNRSINVIPNNFFFNSFQKPKASIDQGNINIKNRKTKRVSQMPLNTGQNSDLKNQGLSRDRS